MQWQDSSFSSCPHFHWPSEDQQMAFKEWQSHVTLMLEASNIPRETWYASIIGFLGTEGFKRWTHLDISKDVEGKENTEGCLHCLRKYLRSFDVPVELHQWDVQHHTSGRARNHWPTWSTYQNLGRKMWLSNQWREGKMLTRATISCDETLQSKKVGKIANSSKRNCNFWKTIAACKTTQSNHQGLSPTQVQWWSCNVYHNQQDQNLHKKRPRISGQSPD